MYFNKIIIYENYPNDPSYVNYINAGLDSFKTSRT